MLGRGRKVLVKRCPLHKEQMNQEKLFRQRVQHEGCKLGASLARFGAARRPVRLQLSREGAIGDTARDPTGTRLPRALQTTVWFAFSLA